jgi:hypothetical protein
LHGALGKESFLKNKKPSLPTAFAPGFSAQFFFKKDRKQPLPMAFARGSRYRFFSKKIKTPLFADGLACLEAHGGNGYIPDG